MDCCWYLSVKLEIDNSPIELVIVFTITLFLYIWSYLQRRLLEKIKETE